MRLLLIVLSLFIAAPALVPSMALADFFTTPPSPGAASVTATGGTAARTLAARAADVANVLDYGAVGNNAADDTAAIQAAINTCAGTVFFPGGKTYIINSSLTLSCGGQLLQGGSRFTATIASASASANVVTCTSGYNSVRSLGFTAASATSGDVLSIGSGCNGFTGEDFIIRSGFNGIHVNAATGVKFNDFEILQYAQAAEYIESTNDVFSNNFIFNAGTAAGSLGGIRLINRAEAIVFSNGDILGGAYSMTSDATTYAASQRPAYNRFTNVFFDSATLNPVLLNKTVMTDFIGCWFSGGRTSTGYIGVQLQAQNDDIHFIGSTFASNGAQGLNITAGTIHTVVTGSHFINNSSQGASANDGMTVSAGTTDFVISGNTFSNSPTMGGTQAYGLRVVAGASDRYSITGNSVAGNATGGIIDGGTGTNKLVQGNF